MKKCVNRCRLSYAKNETFCEICGEKLISESSGAKLKKLFYGVITLLIVIAGSIIFIHKKSDPPPVPDACSPQENVLQKIKNAGVLRVAVESEAPPFNYINEESGKPEGFEYELISYIAKEMGIHEVKLVWTSNYEDIPNMICNERDLADIFMGGYIANVNIPNVTWSDSYYEDNGYCLIVPAGSAIKRLKDLTGKKIGVYNEDAAEEFVQESVDHPQIYRFEDEDEDGTWMITHLIGSIAKQKKRQLVDAIIYDYVFAKEEIKKSDGQLKIVAFNLNKLPYQIGLPKNNYELLKEINRTLKKLMDSPIYAQLVKKYLDFDDSSVSLPALGNNVKKHIVVRGETLGSIAQMELGDSHRWKEIWEINKTRIPNPHLIHVKDELIIP